ncbi:hypothetical protein KBC75_05910 [Candidatus Shapirobacteria bacterium]|nr:hypothetical protein [Candidatus Shapirobacteria bacterium]
MNKIEKNILNKIKSGEIKMKPRWWFVAQNAGINLLFWFSVLVAVGGASYLGYFFDLYRPTEWTEYSQLGIGLVMEDFPIYGSVALIICGILGSWLSLKIGDNYKKGWWKVVATTWGIITIGTIVWLVVDGLF